MFSLTADSANELYIDACRTVLDHGSPASPRGLATTEVLGVHLCLAQPRRRFVDLPPARVLNPAFAVAEAMWILAGSDEPWIFTYNKSLSRYADDGRLQGAYGPRMRGWPGQIDQLDRARHLLATAPDSRQAVIQLYDPQRDTAGHRDVPCTLNYRFFVRDGRLRMHTTMRSNDVWLGLPYDLFTATVVQELMAGWLGVDLGPYHHYVDSLHIYSEHTAQAAEVTTCDRRPSPEMSPLAAPEEALTEFLATVIAGSPPGSASPQWKECADVLASYRGWVSGDRSGTRAATAEIGGVLGDALARWYDRLAAAAAREGVSSDC